MVVQWLCQRLTLLGGDYGQEKTFQSLASRLGGLGSRHGVFYLAIPPSMFPTVVQGLASAGLTDTSRIVVEKPFGRDLASAEQLNRILHEHLEERAIYRIDHYLGKESVEDLLVFGFANSFLEPITGQGAFTHVLMYQAGLVLRDILGEGGPAADYRALPG